MLTAAVVAVTGFGVPFYVWLSRRQAEEARRTLAWFKSSIEK